MLVKIRFKKHSKEKKRNLSFYQIIDLFGNIIYDDLYSLNHEKIQKLQQTYKTGIYECK